VDFGIMSIYKAEYLIDVDHKACVACERCVARCPFGALRMDSAAATVEVDHERCYGCGVCRHVCSTGALFLVPRDRVPALAGKY
jgi:Fe-S-cluster-containing hydrogenase component 2